MKVSVSGNVSCMYRSALANFSFISVWQQQWVHLLWRVLHQHQPTLRQCEKLRGRIGRGWMSDLDLWPIPLQESLQAQTPRQREQIEHQRVNHGSQSRRYQGAGVKLSHSVHNQAGFFFGEHKKSTEFVTTERIYTNIYHISGVECYPKPPSVYLPWKEDLEEVIKNT